MEVSWPAGLVSEVSWPAGLVTEVSWPAGLVTEVSIMCHMFRLEDARTMKEAFQGTVY